MSLVKTKPNTESESKERKLYDQSISEISVHQLLLSMEEVLP